MNGESILTGFVSVCPFDWKSMSMGDLKVTYLFLKFR